LAKVFFSDGFDRFIFLLHFGSGFGAAPCGQIVEFSNLVLSFQFSFWRWSRFWLILACDYLASLSVKSFWRRFFSSALFVVGFAGSQHWLSFFGQSLWLIVIFIWSASL
jgi:hypothetical protein